MQDAMTRASAHTGAGAASRDSAAQTQPLSAVETLDSLIAIARAASASDIHICPERECVRTRLRIDGQLEDVEELPIQLHPAILARIKILAGLRTDEHYSAQDGRFRFRAKDGDDHDIRVSIAPTYYGENAVLRLLSPGKEPHTLRDLGFRSSHRTMLAHALEGSNGMVLATGPTGSGKTTLLYTLVRMLDAKTRSIVTLEDPIEYSLPGISQIPVHADRGLTFGSGLRSVLRQDPDVIMVGEIRDAETARLAVNAALTGHLVLSTLHTNSATATFPRITDLGVEPYLIATTVRLIVAQRLVRRICSECREPNRPAERLLERIRAHSYSRVSGNETFFIGRGCNACRGTGYCGRVGVFEMIAVDDHIREAILARLSPGSLDTLARERGMLSMMGDGLEKVRKGITSVEELSRVTYA